MIQAIDQTILVVGERKLTDWLVTALRQAGFTAEAATKPVAAWQTAKKLPPALLVIDWKIPGSPYDGLELLFNVRNTAGLKAVPVILLVTGAAWYSPDEFFRAISFPPDGYLIKPFNPSELIDNVRRLLPQ